MEQDKKSRWRNAQGWIIFLLFFCPLAVAVVLYYQTDWRPGDTGNHGELVIPAAPTPALGLPTPGGEPTDAEFLRNHWSLVYIAREPCDEDCRTALYNGRQMRLALGRLMDRVHRIYLYTGAAPEAAFIAREHPDLLLADASGEEAGRLLEAFSGQAEGYWLVDPLGNVMMRYPPEQPPRGMLEDIKRLLRLSRIG